MTGEVRRFLLGVLLFGVAGMGAELLLIGHFDEVLQWIPLALLGSGLVALGWLAAAPSAASVRIVQLLMALFVVSGFVGVGLHFRGNLEFEREMYPSMAGAELVTKTLTGATPVLAPGSMALLGLVGLAVTHRHPTSAIKQRETSGGQ